MEAYEKIARILRTDRDYVKEVSEKLTLIAGKNNALERIVYENDRLMSEKLEILGLKKRSADAIYAALIDKIRLDDRKLSEHFMASRISTEEGSRTILNFAKELANVGHGFFLKLDRAREFILKEPPTNIINSLGYSGAKELLDNEDLFEIYSALRFLEPKEWLNDVFFKQLERITPDDFEARPIEVRALGVRWKKAAETFVKKKYHNVSHLKELGLIFVIPEELGIPGEVMRLFTLVLHYLHEIEFYSKLFKLYSGRDHAFATKVISALRGDVLDSRFPEEQRGRKWIIVQRYLAKEDINDWRLFEPHINPEAIHWTKAEDDVARLGERFGKLEFGFWLGLDFVGDYFQDSAGVEVLVSFNLIDTIMSLVQERDLVKYLYHHQEALWNKLFMEYFGKEKTEELIIQNFDRGFIKL